MLTSPAGIDVSRLFSTFDLASRRSVVAAVSGGSDSTALLLLLKSHLERSAPGATLVVVTVDHGLRAGSAAEAEVVARLCARLGIAHRILTWTDPKPAAGVPAAARDARYELLARAARDHSSDLIFTGHTADDQAETVLMRSMRDAGRGVAGMAPATLFEGRVWIARPLLAVRRAALRDYLRQQGFGWIEDPSNVDATYERPRVRATFGAEGGEERLAEALNMAKEAALRRETLGTAAAALIRAHADRPVPGLFRLDPAYLDTQEREAAIYALRVLLAVVGGAPYVTDEARAAALYGRLLAGGPARAVLSRTLVDRRRRGIFLHREARGLPAPAVVTDGMIWDGRYRISSDAKDMWIGPSGMDLARGAKAAKPHVPQSLLRAALAAEPMVWFGRDQPWADDAAPHPLPDLFPVKNGEKEEAPTPTPPSPRFLRGEGKGEGEGQFPTLFEGQERKSASVTGIPLMAPWARYLPSFDLAPARAVAALVGASEIPAPPFQGHNARKA